MSARKTLRVAAVLAAAAAVFTVTTGFKPAPTAAECVPHCYKHPITGELICTPPCP